MKKLILAIATLSMSGCSMIQQEIDNMYSWAALDAGIRTCYEAGLITPEVYGTANYHLHLVRARLPPFGTKKWERLMKEKAEAASPDYCDHIKAGAYHLAAWEASNPDVVVIH